MSMQRLPLSLLVLVLVCAAAVRTRCSERVACRVDVREELRPATELLVTDITDLYKTTIHQRNEWKVMRRT